MNGSIYFIRPVGEDGPVKVGFSANPAKRLAGCQPASPCILEIAALLSLSHEGRRRPIQSVERRFHERYFRWHLHHEWFAFNPLIAADMRSIEEGAFDLDRLPQPTAATWRLPPATRGTKGHVGRPAWDRDALVAKPT